ncbi:hypothetical protein CJ030_MR5G017079 [Morella rubra]|uniref:Uncharacterized protein n=1 Tax=Morella rubra TaxID=262757 RepID=A0A6A1VPE9_9ROSI|nr:hypothetical protein CJ030_MR5G017079 [Morella rubra]
MASAPLILDISSDDEPGGGLVGAPLDGGGDDFAWLSELLDADDKEPDSDSDEVVVVGEVINAKPKSKSSKLTVRDADDDCIVLEADPDKPVALVGDEVGGSDELLVVGEKGQIACRDYPHPRHLCVQYPFHSTPHDKHCDQCHCYVCESLAPCLHWVTGISSIDHCHATDKDDFWKTQRKTSKLGKSASLPAIKSPDAYLSMARPQLTQSQTLDRTRLVPNPTLQSQVIRSNIIRPCSTVTNYNASNNISQGRSQHSASAFAKNRFSHRSVSQHLHGIRHNAFQRDQVVSIGNSGPAIVPAHTMFKRTGTVRGVLPTRPSAYGSSVKVNCAHAAQYTRNDTPTALTNDRNLFRWQNGCPGVTSESSSPQDFSQPNLGSFVSTAETAQQQISSQPIVLGRTNNGQGYQSHNASPDIYQNGNQGVNASQSICEDGNQIPSLPDPGFFDFLCDLPFNYCQSNQQLPIENSQVQSGGSTHELHPVEECNSQMASASLSESNEKYVETANPSQLESTGSLCEPTPVKEANCEYAGNLNLSSVDLEFENWLLENQSVPVVSDGSVLSQPNHLPAETSSIDVVQQLPIENSQVQSGGSTHELHPVEECNSQMASASLSESNEKYVETANPSQLESTGSLCEPTPVKEANCEYAGNLNLSSVDLEFENWLLENQSVPVVSDGSVLSQPNHLPAETSSIDVGMLLFDFETSWNGLAHA